MLSDQCQTFKRIAEIKRNVIWMKIKHCIYWIYWIYYWIRHGDYFKNGKSS